MKKTLFALSLSLMPLAASAQLGNVTNLVDKIGDLVDSALPIVIGIALLAFFWGLAKFIFAAGEEDKKEEGKRIMIWGAIAIFVMVSIFGIIQFVGNAIGGGIGDSGDFEAPGVNR